METKLLTTWLVMLLIYLTPTSLLETIISHFETLTSQSTNRKVKIKFKVKDLEDEDSEDIEEPTNSARTAVLEIPETPPPSPSPPASPPPTPPPRRPRNWLSIGRGRNHKISYVHPYLKTEK